MPRTIHALAFDSKGKSSLAIPPETPLSDALKAVAEMVISGVLPSGATRVEVFDSDEGRSRTIFPHDGGASHRAEVAKQKLAEPRETPKTKGNKLTAI